MLGVFAKFTTIAAPMKKPLAYSSLISATIAFLIIVSGGSVSFGGTVDAPYEIGTWEGFRSAAISYTFDDNLPNQYAIAVPMFHAAGFKMTLFTVVNTWVGTFTWSQAQTAASYGDEIASHTMTHPSLTTVTAAQLTNELANSQSNINVHVPGALCVTLAYPNCVVPSEAVTAQYYIAARGCSGQLVPSTPSDFMNISSFVCGSQGSIQTPAQFNSLADSAAAANSWCVYLIHALDTDNGYSPLPSATLQASLNYMSTNQNKFWVETFGNVVRYIKERNAASVTEASNESNSITLQVTDNLDDSIYNYPITLRRPLPANWPAAAVSQNNQPVSVQLVSVNSTNYIMFNVVPDRGNVIISKTALPPVLSSLAMNTPTSLSFRLDGQTGVNYAIYASTDLVNWSPIQTNTLSDTYTNFTVAIDAALQFYRATWVP